MPSENIYPYNCLMLAYEFPGWNTFNKHLILDEDLYTDVDGYGREDEPHVTVLYGLLPEVTIDDVKQHLYPIDTYRAMLNSISIFEGDVYDVVKFDVDCNTLHLTNSILSKKLPYVNDYPEYSPHLTLAYVKPGMGDKYVQRLSKPYIHKPSQFIYSTVDGNKTYFTI